MADLLSTTLNVYADVNSQWSHTFTITNSDGSLAAITGKTFEFAVRNSAYDTGSPAVSVSSTAPTANGSITINATTSQVQVILTPTATGLLKTGGGPYALWMDPGQTDAFATFTGQFICNVVANP